MKLNLNDEEFNENLEAIRLAKERLKKKRMKEEEEEEKRKKEESQDQVIANVSLICFLGIVFYKIMTGTF